MEYFQSSTNSSPLNTIHMKTLKNFLTIELDAMRAMLPKEHVAKYLEAIENTMENARIAGFKTSVESDGTKTTYSIFNNSSGGPVPEFPDSRQFFDQKSLS